MRNFHNVLSDVLEGFYLEDLNVKVDYVEAGEYLVELHHERFSAQLRAIIDRIPIVEVISIRSEDHTYENDLNCVRHIQSDLIDELYDNDVE